MSSQSPLIHFSKLEWRPLIATHPLPVAHPLLLALVVCLLAPEPAHSGDFSLRSLSIRARVSNATTLGAAQPEEADAYDLSAHFATPWLNKTKSGWKIGSQLAASAGLLQSAGEDALTVSLIPEIAVHGKGGGFVLDAGINGDDTTGAVFHMVEIGYRF